MNDQINKAKQAASKEGSRGAKEVAYNGAFVALCILNNDAGAALLGPFYEKKKKENEKRKKRKNRTTSRQATHIHKGKNVKGLMVMRVRREDYDSKEKEVSVDTVIITQTLSPGTFLCRQH